MTKMHEFVARDGNKYYIDLDEGEDISVYNNNNQKVGEVTLMHVNANDWPLPSYFYLQHLDLEKCKRLGIGTEIFRLHKEHFGEPITAANELDQNMDDGSHLIDDGLPFVRRMREKGLICAEYIDDYQDDNRY